MVGLGITFGLLVILEIPLNPANLIILPVLFVITLVPGMLSVMRDLKMLGGGR